MIMQMPILFTPLLNGLLETALNNLLFNEHSMKAARQRLVGRVLRIEIQELSSPLVLVFTEQHLDVLGQFDDTANCTIKTHLPVLLKLRDRQQLSSLIRNGDLVVEGDIQVVQHLVGLLDLAEWDPAEWLAPYVGDLAAQGFDQIVRKSASFVTSTLQHQQQVVAETLTEEWRVAPGSLEVLWFNAEVDAALNKMETLMARLDKLEHKQ